MSKGTTTSRRQRRSDLRNAKMLRIKNMFSFFSPQRQAWHQKMSADGKAAHESNMNRINDQVGEQLELRLKGNYDAETGKGFYGLRNTWADMGYNDAEVKMLEEAWSLTTVKNSDTYREDKKASQKLMKEARQSLEQRLGNAGN